MPAFSQLILASDEVGIIASWICLSTCVFYHFLTHTDTELGGPAVASTTGAWWQHCAGHRQPTESSDFTSENGVAASPPAGPRAEDGVHGRQLVSQLRTLPPPPPPKLEASSFYIAVRTPRDKPETHGRAL